MKKKNYRKCPNCNFKWKQKLYSIKGGKLMLCFNCKWDLEQKEIMTKK